MDVSTQKILIIGVVFAVVICFVAYLALRGPSSEKKFKCPDGHKVLIINPDSYLLKYSGKKVKLSTDLFNEIKSDLIVEDELLQEASESVQTLDQILRRNIIRYNESACEGKETELFNTLETFREHHITDIQETLNEINNEAKDASEENIEDLISLLERLNDQLIKAQNALPY